MPKDPNGAQAKAVWKQLEPALDQILADFYVRLQATPHLSDKIGDTPGMTKKLSDMQTDHWENVFLKDDLPTLETEARKIGSAHVRIGLTSDWFLAGYGRVMMDAVAALLKQHRFTPQRAGPAIQIMIARLFLDMAMANESYSNQQNDSEAAEWKEDSDYQNLRTITGTFANLNEVAYALAMLNNRTARATSSSESVAAAVEELVASINQLSESSQSAAAEAQETNAGLKNGVEGVLKARTAINEVAEEAQKSQASLKSLQDAATEIESFMSVIQSISDQTNLLALNATIEAARAGEAGKGFAVVANEVKGLAGQAARASDDVAARIKTLQEGISQISHAFEATQSAIEVGETTLNTASEDIETAGVQMNAISGRMTEVAQILEQQESSAREISSHVTEMASMSRQNSENLAEISDQIQKTNDGLSGAADKWFNNASSRSLCEMAKVDHAKFKKRVIDTVMGRDNWKSHEIPDCHGCRLGKWYDSVKDAELQATKMYGDLKEPHHRVHATAKKALEAYENGNMEVAFAGLEDLDKASRDVIGLLDDVSHYLNKRESIVERRKRERKIVVGESVELKSGHETRTANVFDEAKHGIGVDGLTKADIGKEFDLNYADHKKGVVRWSNGRRGGIEFRD